jgi:hypothetical protein
MHNARLQFAELLGPENIFTFVIVHACNLSSKALKEKGIQKGKRYSESVLKNAVQGNHASLIARCQIFI